MDPLRAAFVDSLWGTEHFQFFKNADYNGVFQNAKIFPRRNLYKKHVKMDPLGSAFAAFSEDKTFSVF